MANPPLIDSQITDSVTEAFSKIVDQDSPTHPPEAAAQPMEVLFADAVLAEQEDDQRAPSSAPNLPTVEEAANSEWGKPQGGA